MFKNYIKIAWRNLINNKVYSAINILGLAAGMAVALLIGLWVYHEYSYDKFLPNSDRLYQVRRNFNSNGEILNFKTVSLKLAETLKKDIPEIEYLAESDWMGPHGLMVGDKKLYLEGGITGGDFLKMFEFPLIKGNADIVLKDPYSIVLTESTAKALFGNADPINKTVRFNNANDLKVTGLLKDIPSNSSFKFNYLVPFSYLDQTEPWVKRARTGSFTQNNGQQFVKLKAGVSFAAVSAKIKDIEKTEENINAKNSDVVLQPMKNWHLYEEYINGKDIGGTIEYIRMFSIVGILVLLIACINFINLSTARSEKRAREVGVRKAIGSQRNDLILQFLTESALVTFLAFFFTLIFVQLSLPAFNTLTGSNISIPFSNNIFWAVMIGCVLITALVAGSRPAFYLSSFNPVKVLKGRLQVGKSATISRKALVIVQFTCSITLIISTIVIYRQIQYVKERPTGYNIDRLMVTDINEDLGKNFTAVKNELLQTGLVKSVTTSHSPATGLHWHSDIDNWPGKNAGETIEMAIVPTTSDYFKTLGMDFKNGRDFAGTDADTLNVVLNEAAVKRLRLKEPAVGQTLVYNEEQFVVIGVVKDALMASPFAAADPSMFLYNSDVKSFMMYRLSDNAKPQEAIAKLGQIFNKYNPAFPYQYSFADEQYNSKFKQELIIGKLAALFAFLAILISCLGLFGLAAYMAEQRTKEIGVRKVLGASIAQVWMLLSKDFVLLVSISCLIASPIALYFLQNWLQKYDYRVSIGPWVFIASALIAIVITLITISFQAIKAAIANPVDALRSE